MRRSWACGHWTGGTPEYDLAAWVKKALRSVSQVVQHNNRLVFGQDEQGRGMPSAQHNGAQGDIWLRLENGICALDKGGRAAEGGQGAEETQGQ